MDNRSQDQHTHQRPTGTAFWTVVMGELVLREMRIALAPFGINPVQYGVLEACYYSEGGTTVTAIAQSLPVEASTISRQADQLHAKGLLARRRQSADRRVVTLNLTDKGRDLTHKLLMVVADEEAKIGAHINKNEEAALVAIAQKIALSLTTRES